MPVQRGPRLLHADQARAPLQREKGGRTGQGPGSVAGSYPRLSAVELLALLNIGGYAVYERNPPPNCSVIGWASSIRHTVPLVTGGPV